MEKPNTKVLVTYDSQLGSTAEIAKFMGSVLSGHAASVAVKPLSEVGDLEAYDSVILGSAIRYDHWLPDAVAFVKQNETALSKLSVSFFFTCLTLAKPTPEAWLKAEDYADKLRSIAPRVDPIAIGGFAGVLQFSRTPWPAWLALKVLSVATGVKEGDYRDWDVIRSWTLSQLQHSFCGGHFRKADPA